MMWFGKPKNQQNSFSQMKTKCERKVSNTHTQFFASATHLTCREHLIKSRDLNYFLSENEKSLFKIKNN